MFFQGLRARDGWRGQEPNADGRDGCLKQAQFGAFTITAEHSMACSAKVGRDTVAAEFSRHGVAGYFAEHPIAAALDLPAHPHRQRSRHNLFGPAARDPITP